MYLSVGAVLGLSGPQERASKVTSLSWISPRLYNISIIIIIIIILNKLQLICKLHAYYK